MCGVRYIFIVLCVACVYDSAVYVRGVCVVVYVRGVMCVWWYCGIYVCSVCCMVCMCVDLCMYGVTCDVILACGILCACVCRSPVEPGFLADPEANGLD